MARAWTFQDSRQKQQLGDKAPWLVGWIDPDGRRRSKKIGAKSTAQKFSRKLEGELTAGVFQGDCRKQWADFRKEYEAKIASGMSAGTQGCIADALNHFERICKPKRVDSIKTQAIDGYVAKRRLERGRKKGSTVAEATINKELRHLKAVLNVANEWGYLPAVPKVRMLKEPGKLKRYVTEEDFLTIYQACEHARLPRLPGEHYTAAEWWRALITMAYMTGWRVGEPLGLRRSDLDLDAGVAITRAETNKAKRDELVPLHPVVVEHLRGLVSYTEDVFPWPHHRRTLDVEFAKVQKSAGVHLPCPEDHEHTDACYLYSFHDFRRAFATMNAATLSAEALQSLMRHQSYQTTQKYVNMGQHLAGSVDRLHVPAVLKMKAN